MNKFPFGNTEQEHNDFCDTLKCKYGSYCNHITGLCSKCTMEKGTDEEKKELHKRLEHCLGCGRAIGIYGNGYTHNYSIGGRKNVCNVCHDKGIKVENFMR